MAEDEAMPHTRVLQFFPSCTVLATPVGASMPYLAWRRDARLHLRTRGFFMPFDIDCRDTDYRLDPDRPRTLAPQDKQQPSPVRLVGADRAEARATIDHTTKDQETHPWQR